jgi:DeoR/GlpR family transcriptional regulator of sugar metabolism
VAVRPEDRRQRIAEQLALKGEVEFGVLAALFEVSEMTVRRDCEILEQEGVGRRVRGGMASAVSRAYEPPMPMRLAVEAAAKQAIGGAAAALVSDGDTLILDVGTTTLELARHLKGRQGLTVVTASLPIALELGNEPGIRVVVTGGTIRPGELSLTGGLAEDMIHQVNADLAFLGVAGISASVGLTDYNPEDTRVKRAAIDSARRSVVLADSSKLGRVTFSTVAQLSEIDVLVTDQPANASELEAVAAAGVDVVVARARAGQGHAAKAN